MDKEQVQHVVAVYHSKLRELGATTTRHPHDDLISSQKTTLDHCAYMLDQISIFMQEGRKEKAFRWLGFVQGCLWSLGVYSLSDLMEHNRKK